jgi:cobyrinic acid a,c-diamide synthase
MLKECTTPRFLLAAPQSGSGKTTVTCAILRALLHKKLKVAAFKSGPDYIDPMFHSLVIGAESRNLDLFLAGRENIKRLFAKNAAGKDIAVLEGAMGFYDGLGRTAEDSAYDVARTVKAPVILILNAKGAALSLAAQIKGFKTFRPDSNIQGVILNNVRKMSYLYYKEVLEQEAETKLLGFLPPLEDCSFASRHLGLVTAGEIQDLDVIVEKLAAAAEASLDFEGLFTIAQTAAPLPYEPLVLPEPKPCRIAVAWDKAFCFYYQDALDLLTSLGATIIKFSPLTDKTLPPCDGVYLGGGYPELYARELMENTTMRSSLKKALAQGLPCFAECGGFMYLLEHFATVTRTFDWVGAVPGTSHMTKGLQRFGYISLTATRDNLFCRTGESIPAHEFHYSDSTNNGTDFAAVKGSGRGSWECGHATPDLYAGYPHFHLWGNVHFAENFVARCADYASRAPVSK